MKQNSRAWKILVASIVLATSGCGERTPQESAPESAAAVSVVPAPREVISGKGQFQLTAESHVTFAGDAAESSARYFVDLLQRTHGMTLPVSDAATGDQSGTIRFELSAGESASGKEGYSLVSSPRRIVVSASDSPGLFYGAVTLWQLVSTHASGIAVPAATIRDTPRFRWRGLMLDSARHYQPPEFIRRFIDVMALHKFNTLHWHLTDDQAWRLEIKKYPLLTKVGAWRVPAGPAAAADIDPATGKPRLYGGFYSQEEVREIVAYAAARHITIVPEIDMPGHASAAVVAYPQLAAADQPPRQVPADWGIYRNLFNVEESTFVFLHDVLDEVVALFPSEYIHIGGDEAVKDQWRASPRVQERMRELGIEDEEKLQSYFVTRMEQFLNSKGRRLIGWDEILEGGLAPNATVMSWRGIDGAVAAAAAAHDAVLSPWPILYFDNRPLDAPRPPGRGRVVGVEEVYKFDPAPSALSEEQRKHILGVQANIWTEHIRTVERLEYMTFPRAAAIAEVAWSPAKQLDWDSFSGRLPAQLARYRSLGVAYAESSASTPPLPNRRTSHELTQCSDKLVIALEDDAPLQGERAVFFVDIMNPCWLYKDADLSQVTALAAAVGQVPFNFQIGDDVKAIPLRRPATPAGELEVRIDSCEGERIATLPLAPAKSNYAVTQLPPVSIQRREGRHDLCFTFTQATVDPMWVIDEVRLLEAETAAE